MKKQIILAGTLLLTIISFGQNTIPSPNNVGNIGIGTLSPSEKLDVDGYIKLRQGHFIFSSGNAIVNWGSGGANDDLYFRSLSSVGQINTYTDRIRVKYNGWTTFWGGANIVSSNPSDQIHVFPSSGATGITITNASSTSRSAITLENSSSSKKYLLGTTGSSDVTGSGNLVIRDATLNLDRVIINSAGYTGIGGVNAIINPIAPLHVCNTGVNTGVPSLIVENTSQGIYQNNLAQLNKVTTANIRGFVVANTMSTPGEVFKVYGDGRTLIGLSAASDQPSSMLHIKGITPDQALRVYNSTGTSDYLSLWHNGSAGSVIDPVGSNKLYLGYNAGMDVYIGGNNNGANPFSRLGIGTNVLFAYCHIKTPTWHGSGGHGTLLEYNDLDAGVAEEIRTLNAGAKALLVSKYTFNNNTYNYEYEAFKVYGDGRTVIGNPLDPNSSPYATTYSLSVKGQAVFQEVIVTNLNWSDFVFANDYKLPKLKDVETYYKENKHLPEIPSAKEVEEKGISVGEMNKLLLQKIEELTIYVVDQQKQIDALKEKNNK